MPATIYIAPAVTERGSYCNVYRFPYHVVPMDTSNTMRGIMHVGILEWDYRERNFRIICLDRSLVGDLTDEDFKCAIGGTYYLID